MGLSCGKDRASQPSAQTLFVLPLFRHHGNSRDLAPLEVTRATFRTERGTPRDASAVEWSQLSSSGSHSPRGRDCVPLRAFKQPHPHPSFFRLPSVLSPPMAGALTIRRQASVLPLLLALLQLAIIRSLHAHAVAHTHAVNGGFALDDGIDADGQPMLLNDVQHFASVSHSAQPGSTSAPASRASIPAHLVCSACGHVLGDATQLLVVRSPAAIHLHNISLPAAAASSDGGDSDSSNPASQRSRRTYPVQTFRNPAGHVFDLLCMRDGPSSAAAASAAAGTGASLLPALIHSSQWFGDATWFAHCEWSIAGCGKCHRHVGWKYRRQSDADEHTDGAHSTEPAAPPSVFVGLIVDAIQLRSVESVDHARVVTLAALNQTVVSGQGEVE